MRTEEEVLKDFENLIWNVDENNNERLRLSYKKKNGYYEYLEIDKEYKDYCRYEQHTFVTCYIPINQHKLLNELFSIWGWL